MRRSRIVGSAVLILLLLASCQSMQEASPEVHVANAKTVYTAAVVTMNDLIDQGVVGLELAEQFNEVRLRVQAMLKEADVAVAAGATFSFVDLSDTMASLTTILAIAMKGATP